MESSKQEGQSPVNGGFGAQGMGSGIFSGFPDQASGNVGAPNTRDLLSMNGVSGASVTKLNGSNYMPWRRQLGLVMRLSGLDVALTDPCPPQRIEDLAMLLITQTVDDAHKLQIQAEETAREALSSLDRQYANRSIATKHKLLSEFFQFRKASNDNINQHLGKLKELRAALNNLNERFSEDFFQVVLINSLPPEYGDLMSQWEMIHPSMKNTEFLMQMVQTKEKNASSPGAILLAHGKANSKPLSLEEKKKKFPCKCCGEFGHWVKECKCAKCHSGVGRREPKVNFLSVSENPLIQLDDSSGTSNPAHVIFSLGKLGSGLKNKWILDSGATQHMCNRKDWFSNLTLYEKPIMATVGNGDQIEVWGHGSIEVYNSVGGLILRGTLTEVSYIPSLAANLMSVSAVSKNGIRAAFNGKECSLLKGNKQVATGCLVDSSLYVMNVEVVPPKPTQALIMRASKPAKEWHEILGHPSEARMAKLFKDRGLGIEATGSVGECGPCPASKATHVAHPSSSCKEVSEVGERVHVDLGVLRNKIYPSYDYYMLCKDELSHYSFIYFLDNKAKVNQCLARLFVDFEYGCGKPIRCLRSDNGSEFLNRQNELLFAKERCVHETSAPYIAQQNGAIEREMRTINTMATALLCQAAFTERDNFLKVEALRTACFLKNRVPTTMSNLTPFELFTGRKPRLAHLERFGTPVQILDNVHQHQKLDPKTVNGYITGFTSRCNTYRVFVPSYKRIIETCDVYKAPHLERLKPMGMTSEEEVNLHLPNEVLSSQDKVKLVRTSNTSEVECMEHLAGGSNSTSQADDEFETANCGEVQSSTMQPQARGRGNNKPYLTGKDLDSFFEQYRMENAPSPTGEDSEKPSSQVSQNEQTDIAPVDDLPPTPPPRLSSRETSFSDSESAKLPPRLSPRIDSVDDGAGTLLHRSGSQEDGAVWGNHSQARSLLLMSANSDEPKNYKQAISGPNREEWEKAISEEVQALEDNGTWEEVDRPTSGTTMTTKWVFALKRKICGTIERYKARLVARGFEQKYGVDFFEIYAPVAHTKSIRAILALAGVRQLQILQFDVSSAFLHGSIDETIYIEPPEGLNVRNGKCLRLVKALYGLRQAPRAWNQKLDRTLKEIGLVPTVSDPCVYTNDSNSVHLVVYVDDGLVVGKDVSECMSVIDKLGARFKIKRLSGELFVGVEITRTVDSLLLSQSRYTKDILRRFNMADVSGATSPTLDIKALVEAQTDNQTKAPYREAIGSLLYLANWTRPDILFMVNLLARFNQAPTDAHWTAVKHIMRYLKATPEYCLEYKRGLESVVAYSDADWGSKIMERYSMSGVMVTLGGNPIAFSSKKQSTIALSSTEAEYYAACEASRELKWVVSLFKEIGFANPTPTLFIDNHSTIKQIKSTGTSNHSKHIDIKYHYIRREYRDKLFNIEAVSTHNQAADILTKPLGGKKLKELIETTKIMATKRPSGMAKVTMMLMTCIALACVDAIKFERADPLVWKTSEHRVTTGTQLYQVNFLPMSPCRLNNTYSAIEHNIQELAEDQLKAACEERYVNYTLRGIEAFIKCQNQRGHDEHNSRRKRWLEPITLLLLLGTAVVAAVGALSGLAYSYWDEDSSYNRLNKAEEREKEREKKVDENINQLKALLVVAKGEREKHISVTEKLTDQIAVNAGAIKNFAKITPHIAFTAADMAYDIKREGEMWHHMADACRENQISPDEYATLFKLKSLRNVKPINTFLDSVSRNERGVVTIEFFTTRESSSSRIINMVPQPHWVDVISKPKLMVYNGPLWVAYNRTSDCAIGVDDPRDQPVYQNCTIPGFRDPGLRKWIHIEEGHKDFDRMSRPRVVKTATENIIYCLYNKITLDNHTVDCPPYPFKLPTNVPFRLYNQGHEFTTEYVKVHEREVNYRTPHLDIYGTDAEYTKLINMLRESNAKSLGSTGFALDNGRIAMNLEVTTLLIICGIFSGLLFLFVLLYAALPKRKEKRETSHQETPQQAPQQAPQQINTFVNTAPAELPIPAELATLPERPAHANVYQTPGQLYQSSARIYQTPGKHRCACQRSAHRCSSYATPFTNVYDRPSA